VDYFYLKRINWFFRGINHFVRLVGSGEPTVHPDFASVIQIFHDEGHRLKLITNGQLLSKYREEISANLDALIVSVHGDEQTHDLLVRRTGSYYRLMHGLEDVLGINPKMDTTLHFVITPENYHQMGTHVGIAKKIGVKARFQHLAFTAGDINSGKFDLDLLKEMVLEIKAMYPEVRFVPELTSEQIDSYYDTSNHYIRNPHGCHRILTDLAVRYDGKVIMCDNKCLGDITNQSIIDIISGEQRRQHLINRTEQAHSPEGLPLSCSRCCYN